MIGRLRLISDPPDDEVVRAWYWIEEHPEFTAQRVKDTQGWRWIWRLGEEGKPTSVTGVMAYDARLYDCVVDAKRYVDEEGWRRFR